MPISAGRSSLNVPRVLLATLILAVGPGCSLIFTRGPDPEAKPPPECTTSVAAPVVDTVLAVGSFALLGAGIAELGTTCQPNGFNFCSIGQTAGWGAVIAGAVTGILFTSSAAVGYTRTSACRTFKDTPGLSPPTPAEPPKSLLKHGSAQACEAIGDAPRVCPSVSLLNPGPVPLAAPH